MHSEHIGKYGVTNSYPYQVTATFNEPVHNFDAQDVTVTGGTIHTVTENAAAAAYGSGALGAFSATSNTVLDTSSFFAGFDYSSFSVASGVTVTVTGCNALVIRCTGSVSIEGTLDLTGAAGRDGGGSTGGGGGAGGGAVSDEDWPRSPKVCSILTVRIH